METLRGWESVKDRVHDVSGIESPERWLFKNVGGIFYPERVKDSLSNDELFDLLDPDMSDEELVSLGYDIKYSISIGSDGSTDWREGCGHVVIDEDKPEPERKKIGF